MSDKMTFGVIVSTRGFFPASLAEEGRKEILALLDKKGIDSIIVSENDTPHGAIETLEDAQKCADLFQENRKKINGILVILPNFGDEQGVVQAVELAGLDVPIMVQASDDSLDLMDISHRRDSFCGKLSVCNNFYQRGIKFTNTTLHTCAINSPEFEKDIDYFVKVCRVVSGLKGARLGAIGTRPDPFNTVRFSEKLLQDSGITVSTVDLSEIIFAALKMETDDAVNARVKEIHEYGNVPDSIPDENVIKSAKLSLVLEKWVEDKGCDATAIQCWSSIQENYGCATCLPMSMMGEKGKPSACEMDVTGALTMLALKLASGNPSGYIDWNNNFENNRDMCIGTHCSNYPKSFFATDFEISNLDILGASLGSDRCFGACKAQVAKGPMTFAKISTDDTAGKIKMYVGEGDFTDDPVDTMGGVAVCSVPKLQKLMDHMCQNGFEHHVAMNRGHTAKIIAEACGKYLGWDVYVHNEE